MTFFKGFVLLLLTIPSLAFAQFVAPSTMPTILPAGTKPAVPVSAVNAPRIYCPYPEFNFHNVDEGGDIVHLFRIENRGKSTLKITSVSTSCGCTAAVEDRKEIPPGGHGVVKATYHTQGRPGHATKIITIVSNDPVHPNYQLQLQMTVIRQIDIEPERIYMYNVPHGQSQTTTVRILGKPWVDLKILSAQATTGSVTVTSIEPISNQATHQYGAVLQVEVPATRPIGNFTDTIQVKTNWKRHALLSIDVWGEVIGKYTYAPHTIYFSPHQTTPMTVSFTAQNPGEFVIRSVRSVNHLARPYVKKMNFGNGVEQYQVVIEPPKHVPQNSDGKDTILVMTNDQEQPQVSIDVQVSK